MLRRTKLHSSVIVTLTVAVCSAAVHADVIRLKNGGEVRGKFDTNTLQSGSKSFTIETLSGAIVIVGRKHLEFIARRPLKVEEYESRAKLTPHSVEAQQKLADWCLAHRLKEQHQECLNRIVNLDPENETAHLELGHKKYKGVWMTPQDIKRAQGFVRYKGKYITTQEFELRKKTGAERELEKEWYKKIRLWKNWLSWKTSERRSRGLAELQEITQPEAVPALKHFFQNVPNKIHRTLYVRILSQIPGPHPVSALVEQSLRDSDFGIRDLALEAIAEDQFETAVEYFIENLKSDRNYVIRRAAIGLAKVGGEEAIPKLINALVTTHTFRIKVPDTSNTYSFGTDGSFGTSGPRLPPEIELQLRTGQLPHGVIVVPWTRAQQQKTKIITFRREIRNSEVLAVLEKFTDKSFRYDKRSWKLWLAAKNKGLIDTSTVP